MKLGLKYQKVSLADYTTFKLGGCCDYFFEIEDTEQLSQALKFAKEKKLPCLILGQGSNLLISDNGFQGVVIKIQMKKFSLDNDVLTAEAGCLMEDLVKFTLENGLGGLEWASGLPGTLGGAVRGNAGAFRRCMSKRIIDVKFMNSEYEAKTINKENCRFAYRESVFKYNHDIILEAKLKLVKAGNLNNLLTAAKRYVEYRKTHHPLQFPNAGSVFKNIEDESIINRCVEIEPSIKEKISSWGGKLSAGFLIENCGLKGYKTGDAQISEQHANFIVNLGNAKTKDVLDIIECACKKVYEKFGVNLELEIQLVNV